MKRFKNKKTLAIAGVAVAVLAIAGTIAYNQDSMFFANLFHIGADYAEFSDTFESPENWTPCTETPKTAIATNKSDAPRYVRMKIEEYWRAGDTTTPESDHETTDLPLTWNDNGTEKHYAIINTQNDDQWSLANDGWYYYDHALVKDESTLSLLKSVTFNCEVNTVGEMRYSADGKSGESIPSEYGGAKYHIYVTFQMSSEPLRTRTRLYDTVANQTLGSDSWMAPIISLRQRRASILTPAERLPVVVPFTIIVARPATTSSPSMVFAGALFALPALVARRLFIMVLFRVMALAKAIRSRIAFRHSHPATITTVTIILPTTWTLVSLPVAIC